MPSIFTFSGVAAEFIVNEQNALVVPFGDPESIYNSIVRIINDYSLRKRLIENGKKSATLFPLNEMIGLLEELYAS